MPRALTWKEIRYLLKLYKRNETMDPSDPQTAQRARMGLQTPMPPRERMMRKRIRRKALQMGDDLVVIDLAGLLPYRPKDGERVPEVRTMIDDVWNQRVMQSILARILLQDASPKGKG